MQLYLEKCIDKFMEDGITLIVDGINIEPKFMKKMAEKYGN